MPTDQELLEDSVRGDVESDQAYFKDKMARLETLKATMEGHVCKNPDTCDCEKVYQEINELEDLLHG